MKDSYKRLLPHLNTRQKIRVRRDCSKESFLHGYLMGLSKVLGVMHCFYDFDPYGYTVFRLQDVTGIRSGKYERHWDRMLCAEGLLNGLNRRLEINLSNIESAIRSSEKYFNHMIVECEKTGTTDRDFYIGQVLSTKGKTLRFNDYDALGRWQDEPATIPWNEITLLQFDTPYINIFKKYLSGNPPGQ